MRGLGPDPRCRPERVEPDSAALAAPTPCLVSVPRDRAPKASGERHTPPSDQSCCGESCVGAVGRACAIDGPPSHLEGSLALPPCRRACWRRPGTPRRGRADAARERRSGRQNLARARDPRGALSDLPPGPGLPEFAELARRASGLRARWQRPHGRRTAARLDLTAARATHKQGEPLPGPKRPMAQVRAECVPKSLGW